MPVYSLYIKDNHRSGFATGDSIINNEMYPYSTGFVIIFETHHGDDYIPKMFSNKLQCFMDNGNTAEWRTCRLVLTEKAFLS